MEEPDYAGPRFEARDDALVVGGGLASIDVAKVLMLETTRAALAERGVEVPMPELEVRGIPKLLQRHGLRFEELGLAGCTLFYRRRAEDMPLVEAPEGADEARLAKVQAARRRLLEKAQEKYRFGLEPLSSPEALLIEGDRVVGLRLRRTRVEAGRVVATDEVYERRGSCVVSSIGSIPEPIPGIEMKGELFDFSDWEYGRLDGYPNVFSVGNVVTGKGNIVASRKHATHVSEDAVEAYLGLSAAGHSGEEGLLLHSSTSSEHAALRIAGEILRAEAPPPEIAQAILERVRKRQEAVGYGGDLRAWLASSMSGPPSSTPS